MKFCPNCGNKLNENVKFCGNCGKSLNNVIVENNNTTNTLKIETVAAAKNILDKATSKINEYTDESGSVEINLRSLFSEVTKKHTKESAENIFIVGTHKTTPELKDVSEEMAKPWLFSRVFLYMAIVFVTLWFAVGDLNAENAIPGFIMVGAFAVPFSALIFFFELNAFKNISITKTVEMFLVGGTVSIVAALVLFEIFPMSLESQVFGILTTGDAITIGVIEEVGKLLLVLYYVNKLNTKYILNGLLIGCAIGAGFAAFETAGYIFHYWASGGNPLEIMAIRGGFAVGGHLIWTAIAGGALVMVKKIDKLAIAQLLNQKFLFFFISVVAFHAIWDMEFVLLGNEYIKPVLLSVIAWIEVFVLINAGVKEIVRYKN